MRRLLTALLVLVAVALAFRGVLDHLGLRRLQDSERAAVSALATARSYAVDLLSYDYRTIDRDLARARGHATGPLADQYRRLAERLAPDARRRQTVQQATVVAAGVESATPDKVQVLVFVNLITTRTGPGQTVPRQQVTRSRARLVLVTQGDGWQVSGLSSLLGDTPAR
jgi:Mce-associated membrane protein